MDFQATDVDFKRSTNIISSDDDDDEKGKPYEVVEGENHIFHVLAVDDSLIDRKLLERLLTVSSYQVTCVDSGDKALEYLGLLGNIKENEIKISKSSATAISCDDSSNVSSSKQEEASKVNLIMTDYSMPGISGYDLLKRIKESSWKDVPVIVMSSENVPSRINMCLEGGAEEFLLKPVKLSDLSNLHSHILKNAISQNPNTHHHHEIAAEGGKSASNDDVDYKKHAENDENCSNANRRRTSLKTTPDVRDRRPRVQELPVS